MLYRLLQLLFPKIYFKIPVKNENVWFLTFDDGPTETITSWVLDCLNEYNVKANFFVLGKNVERNQDLYLRLITEAHDIGNHGYSHLHGWKTIINYYLKDIEKAKLLISSDLFRPPYGKMGFLQYLFLRKKYNIILWSETAKDWNSKTKPTQQIFKILKNADKGAIFLFHDNEKSFEHLKIMLPIFIEYARENDIKLGKLSEYI